MKEVFVHEEDMPESCRKCCFSILGMDNNDGFIWNCAVTDDIVTVFVADGQERHPTCPLKIYDK